MKSRNVVGNLHSWVPGKLGDWRQWALCPPTWASVEPGSVLGQGSGLLHQPRVPFSASSCEYLSF